MAEKKITKKQLNDWAEYSIQLNKWLLGTILNTVPPGVPPPNPPGVPK